MSEVELGEMPIVSTRSNNSISKSPYSFASLASGGESIEDPYLQSGTYGSSGSSQQRPPNESSIRTQPAFTVNVDVSDILSNIKLEHNSNNSNLTNQPREGCAHYYSS